MIAFAVLFGLLAVFVAQSWLNSATEQRMRSLEANKKPLNTSTIVVASKPLRYGTELTPQVMRQSSRTSRSLP
jgi:pilus assembly protein CpaB